MKHALLLVFLLLGCGAFSTGQSQSKGKFSNTLTYLERTDKVPVGKHTATDKEERLKFTLWYFENGQIEKAIINKKEYLFPPSFQAIEWVEIQPGLWINKTNSSSISPAPVDGEKDIKLHYAGYLLHGACFDNSFVRNQPITGQYQKFIKGFSQGVANMQPGELRVIKISPELGYGNQKGGNIPPSSTLIYFVYLME